MKSRFDFFNINNYDKAKLKIKFLTLGGAHTLTEIYFFVKYYLQFSIKLYLWYIMSGKAPASGLNQMNYNKNGPTSTLGKYFDLGLHLT